MHLTAITQVQNLSSDFIAAKGVHVVRVHKGDPVPVSVPLTVPGGPGKISRFLGSLRFQSCILKWLNVSFLEIQSQFFSMPSKITLLSTY